MKPCPDFGFEKVLSTPTTCQVFKALTWEERNQISLFFFPNYTQYKQNWMEMTPVLQPPLKVLITALSLKGEELPLKGKVKYH